MDQPPQDDDRLTAFGLLVETSTALIDKTRRQIESQGVSLSEFETLLRLSRTPGHRLRMTDLAAQTGLSASGLTRLVDRLQAGGLLHREACEDDRRGFFAVLTDAGLTRIEALLPGHLDLVEEQFSSVLTAEEADELTRVLRKLRAVVRPDAVAGADRALADPVG